MRLSIKRQEFLKMLNFVSQAIPAKSAENQFMNFLIQTTDNEVSVIASDGNLSAKSSLQKQEEKINEKGEKETIDNIISLEPGLIQTPAKYLLDIIAKLSGDVITLDLVDTNYLHISDGIAEFNLVTQNGEEYPDVDLNIPEDKKSFKLSVKDLNTLFSKTSFAVATKGPRELFTGILVKAHAGKLSFLATDSLRIAKYSISVKENEDETEAAEFSFTSPVKPLAMACKISNDPNEEVEIYFDEQRALFVADNIILSTRLIKGEFPPTDRLIPNTTPYVVNVDTQEFLQTADRMKIISSAEGKSPSIRMILSKTDGVTIYSKSTNYGDSNEQLRKANIQMPDEEEVFEIGFNIDYAIDAVKALGSDHFSFLFTSPTRIIQVKSDDTENIQIFTPLKLSSTR